MMIAVSCYNTASHMDNIHTVLAHHIGCDISSASFLDY